MSQHSRYLVPKEEKKYYDNRMNDTAGCRESIIAIVVVIALCVAGYYLWKYFNS